MPDFPAALETDAAVLEIDASGHVAVATPAAASLVGASPDEAAGRPFAAWLVEEDRPAASAVLARVRDGEMDRVSLRVEGPDDRPLWVTLHRLGEGRIAGRVRSDRRARPSIDAATQADRLRLLATVTSQGDLPFEDQVHQALALTSTLLGLDIGILSQIEGADYTIVACHAPGAGLAAGDRFPLGDTYCSITLEGRDLLAIDHMAASPHRRHPCYETFGLEAYVGIPVFSGDDPWGTLCFSAAEPLAAPLPDADLDLVRVLATWVGGALERRARAAALAEEAGRLRAVIDAAPVVLYALDAEGRFTLSEGRGLTALGLDPGGLVGQSVFEAYADVPGALAPIRDVLGGSERTWTVRVGPLTFESWGTPVRDGGGRVVGMTGVSIDVTAVHEAEARVRREGERLHRLLDVTADDGPFEERAEAVLAELARLLGLDGGLLARTLDGTYTCLASWSADGAPLPAGARLPLAETYCDLAVEAEDVVAIGHMAESEHRDHACYATVGHEAYIGAPVRVDGAVHGSISFFSGRPAPFTESDRELVRLAAQWAGGLLEREARQRALAASERRLRALSASTTEAIAFLADGVILDCNDQFARLFRLEGREAAVGTAALGYAAPEHREAVRRAIVEGRTEPYEVEGVRADGSRFWAEVQGGPAEYGGRPVRMTALRDITRRKEALAQTRFQADVLANVSDAVVALDLDGRVTYWNAGAERIHGLPAEAVLGRPLGAAVRYELLSTDAPGLDAEDALREVATTAGDLVYEAPDGRRRVVSVSVSAHRDAEGAERGTLAVLRDVTASREMAAQLRHQATHDALTGLPNRTRFRSCVERALRRGAPFAVLFIDLDRFKVVNDSLGHEAGDRLLRAVAARLRAAVGEAGTAARFGGDEFAAVVPTEEAEDVARRVLDALAAPVDLGPRAIAPGASVGVVPHAERYRDPESLLRDADTAMYEAKRAGRGGHAVFDASMHQAATARFGLEHDLREAVGGDQLRLRFQPIVDLATGAAAGLEALVRWEHPTEGLCGPAAFVPLAEELGIVADIDRWVLDATCRELAAWPDVPGPLLMVNVNCSDQSFLVGDLADRAHAAAQHAGIEPGQLVLELTERALVASGAADGTLQSLRERGIRLCVDDFGSGYSSLGLLHRLPVDGLKIDRSFVTDLETSAEAQAVVRAVVGLARDLGLRVVAEGIETRGQLDLLRQLGCPYGQGFLFSPPVPPAVARDLLARAPWADGWPG